MLFSVVFVMTDWDANRLPNLYLQEGTYIMFKWVNNLHPKLDTTNEKVVVVRDLE